MARKSEITIYEFEIRKDTLMGIPERERMFFLLLGLAANEIVMLNRIALAVDQFNRKTEGIERRAYATQGVFLARLIVGKLFEAWSKAFQQIFFNSPFRRDYESALSERAKTALTELSQFFAKNADYLAVVRNEFAFHFPSRQLVDAMPHIPESDGWSIYLSKASGNSLYYVSEVVAGFAMLRAIDPNLSVGIDKLIRDRDWVAKRFANLAEGCMSVFVERHLHLRMSDGKPSTLRVPGLLSVQLPFFTALPGSKRGNNLRRRRHNSS